MQYAGNNVKEKTGNFSKFFPHNDLPAPIEARHTPRPNIWWYGYPGIIHPNGENPDKMLPHRHFLKLPDVQSTLQEVRNFVAICRGRQYYLHLTIKIYQILSFSGFNRAVRRRRACGPEKWKEGRS
ncbi:MAG: hypothetical protein HZA50_09785 [Planctomycetes bacterium]|nr:hypothetical protein [Planctomycetota bacterium]